MATPRVLVPRVLVHRPPVNRPPTICPLDKKTSETGHRSQSPVKWALHMVVRQSVTCHRPSSHRSLDLETIVAGESLYSLATGHQSPVIRRYQSIISDTITMRIEFTTNSQKRAKHCHKKRRRRHTYSSSSLLSDNQSHDYGRYKRSRYSP